MSNWKTIPEAQVQELAGWLVSLPWPLSEEKVLELAGSRGWRLVAREPESGVEWETGLMVNRPWAEAIIIDGVVSRMVVTMSEVLPQKTEETIGFLRDVFAEQVAILSQMLGRPTKRTPGARAAVRWLLPNGSALRIGLGLSCTWSVRSPEFVQIEADLLAAEAKYGR